MEAAVRQLDLFSSRCHSGEGKNPSVSTIFLDSGSPLRCGRNDFLVDELKKMPLNFRVSH
jgi:hypothetical protein